MSWVTTAFKIAGAIGSLATAYSVARGADLIANAPILRGSLTPSQSSQDVVKQAEMQAQHIQTITGTDNPQSGAVSGLPDQQGPSGKLLAALAALGLGAGALGTVALTRGRRGGGKARGRRRGRTRRRTKSYGRRRTSRRSRGGRRF